MKKSAKSSISILHLVKKQAEGNLTVAEFCRRHQIKPHKFFYWKKKIREREEKPGNYSKADFSPAPFIPIAIPAMAGGKFTDKIELHFPSGLQARIPVSARPEAIRSIIKACGN